MGKRFTDTEKWKKPWYRKLGSRGRDIWNWIYDNCEAAGVWEIDTERMTFDLGFAVEKSDVLTIIPGAKEIGDNKIFFANFLAFQYGRLSEDCNPHIPIIRRLKELNLWEGYLKGLQTLMDKEKDKDKEKVKEKDKEKEGAKFKISKAQLDDLYSGYPRKEGKSRGYSKLAADLQSIEDVELCHMAIKNYVANLKKKGTEADFVKLFSTFAHEWRDWVEPGAGRSEDFAGQPARVSIAELLAAEKNGEAS